jgi:hypothetical protein
MDVVISEDMVAALAVEVHQPIVIEEEDLVLSPDYSIWV